MEIRKELTDEWKKHGLQEGVGFAFLTDVIYTTWAGKTAKEYKQFKDNKAPRRKQRGIKPGRD